jgi:hypothetical protein
VYLLTGPRESGIVPIGNDYLLTFSPDGKLRRTERLHNSYLPMGKQADKGEIKALLHSHLAAHPYITASDICTTLLYRDQVSAHQHYVISDEYVSILDIDGLIRPISHATAPLPPIGRVARRTWHR